jgi:prepilin-type N-terminal cleavage/methylation domain-containing protein
MKRRKLNERGVTLAELLVVIAIMSVVGTMLVVTWVSLSNSFASTTRSSDARDYARQAASRMEREIRDAEAQLTTGNYMGSPAILWASANQIIFVTTFNDAGNDLPSAKPLAIKYFLESGTLYMQRDANDDGHWDTARPISSVPNVVNGSVGPSGSTPVFGYTYVNDNGDSIAVHPTDDAQSLPETLRARITSVSFTLIVDANLGHPPAATTITTTAQLRNQRQF